jgi:hypothetical protein
MKMFQTWEKAGGTKPGGSRKRVCMWMKILYCTFPIQIDTLVPKCSDTKVLVKNGLYYFMIMKINIRHNQIYKKN